MTVWEQETNRWREVRVPRVSDTSQVRANAHLEAALTAGAFPKFSKNSLLVGTGWIKCAKIWSPGGL